MVKWVARLAIVAALLGIAGTIVIIFHFGDEGGKGEQQRTQSPVEDNIIADTPVIKAPPSPSRSATIPITITRKEENPEAVASPKKEVEKQSPKPPLAQLEEKKDNAEDAGDKKKTVKQTIEKKEPQEKLFTPEELEQLVNDINTAKEENDIYSNCVQIFSTPQSSNTSVVSQVEAYLRNNRFAIAGREITHKKVKGILITPQARCIRITIGSL